MTGIKDHDGGVKQLCIIISNMGIVRLRRTTSEFRGYHLPDIVTLIGPRYKDRIVIDYVHTSDSFNRVLGGMVRLASLRTFAHYVMVLNDDIWDYFEDEAKSHPSIVILPFKDFKEWLEFQIS